MSDPGSTVPADGPREIPLHHFDTYVCELCLSGAGGECHVPGCRFWLHDAPEGVFLEWLQEQQRMADWIAKEASDA